jgi:hypothetical protein
MAKKRYLVWVLLIFVAVGVFAEEPGFKFSAGFGGYFTGDLAGGIIRDKNDYNIIPPYYIMFDDNPYLITPYFGGGAFLFIDATFLELNMGLFVAGGEWMQRSIGFDDGYSFGDEEDEEKRFGVTVAGIDFGLMAKYPFAIDTKTTAFPLLGITYRNIFSADISGMEVDEPGNFSALWFKFGGGADVYIAQNTYVRFELLFGLRLKNDFEKKLASALEKVESYNRDSKSWNNNLGHGLDIKIAVGRTF